MNLRIEIAQNSFMSESLSSSITGALERTLPADWRPSNIEVSGDVSQLLIQDQVDYFNLTKGEVSDKPLKYVPPKYRKIKKPFYYLHAENERQSVPQMDEEFIEQLKGTDEQRNAGIKLKPIEKGEKVTLKQLQCSLGGLKKVPRVRELLSTKKQSTLPRLPPPPIGESVGHGIIDA